jgi:hypothetical protein
VETHPTDFKRDLQQAEADVRRKQEAVWNGPVTRGEMFNNLQLVGRDMQGQRAELQNTAALVMFIVEKLGITQEEIGAWTVAKKAALEADAKSKTNGHVPLPTTGESAPDDIGRTA